MIAPLTGIGMWIWRLAGCERGNVHAMITRCKETGIAWVAVKCGGNASNGQITADLVRMFRDAGIPLVAWWYSVPSSLTTQLEMLQQMRSLGVEYFVIDAETEWEADKQLDGSWRLHDYRPLASVFAHQIRAVLGTDAYFADAPFPIKRAHSKFPYDEFGSVCDARMPQNYYAVAKLDGGEEPFTYLDDCDVSWAISETPVCPILSNTNAMGTEHCDNSVLTAAIHRYRMRQCVSVWSWDDLNAFPAQWAALERA